MKEVGISIFSVLFALCWHFVKIRKNISYNIEMVK